MELFAILGIYIGVCMLLVAIFVLGPTRSHRDGLLGKAHRALSSIPSLLGTCCCLLCTRGRMGKAQERWHSCSDSTTNKKHPALVVFYIILVWGVDAAFLYYVVPEMPSLTRKFVSTFLVVLSEYCYIAACRADPGVVSGSLPNEKTDDNIADEEEESGTIDEAKAGQTAPTPTLDLLNRRTQLAAAAKAKAPKKKVEGPLTEKDECARNNRYPFDGVLYSVSVEVVPAACEAAATSGKRKKGREGGSTKNSNVVSEVEVLSVPECYTCNVPRPARSKHCSMCDQCVRRYDHHCPWINNDVGEGNLRYFMAFLITHVMTCFFCGTECLMNVLQFVDEAKVWRSMFVGVDGRRSAPSLPLVIMYTVSNKTVVCCVVLFAYIIGLMLLWFWGHHMWLAMRNITTNEEGKIDMIMDYIGSIRNFAAFEQDIIHTEYVPPTPEKIAAAKKAGTPLIQSKAEFTEKLERRRLAAEHQLERTKPSFLSEYVAAQIYVFYTEYEKKIRREEARKVQLKVDAQKMVLAPGETPMRRVNPKTLYKLRRIPEKKFHKALVKTFDCGSKWANLMESLFPERPSGVSSQSPSVYHQARARLIAASSKLQGAGGGATTTMVTTATESPDTYNKRIATVEGPGVYVGSCGRNLVSFAVGDLVK